MKIIRFGLAAVVFTCLLMYYGGTWGCGLTADSSGTTAADAETAADNNASRALATEVMTISTTIPSN